MKIDKRIVVSIISFVLVSATGSIAYSQGDFPNKPLTMIIPFEAGGGTDVAARILIKTAEKHLGKAITPVNLPGGSSAIGLTKLGNSSNDGYTLATTTSSIYTLKPQGRMAFSPMDFEPIIGFNANFYCIAVPAKSEFKTIEQLIAYAKNNPKKLNAGISAIGSNLHLFSVAFKKLSGVIFNIIPAPGGINQVILETAGGNLDVGMGGPNEFLPQVKIGNVRILAMAAPERIDDFPDIPTLKEKGLDLSFTSERFILAPQGTQEQKIKILHDAFKKGMADPVYEKYVKSSGSNPFYVSYGDAKKYIKQKADFYYELLEEANLLKKGNK